MRCFGWLWILMCHINKRIQNEEYLRRVCWGEWLNLSRRKEQEAGGNCIMRSFITCTLQQKLLTRLNQGGHNGWIVVGMRETRNAYKIVVRKRNETGFKIILEWILEKHGEKLIGFIWLRIKTNNGLLRTR